MRVLVTGASGFVGSQVVTFLVEKNHEVAGISRSRERLPTSVLTYNIDLGDGNSFREIVESFKPECVVHLAWYVEHGRFWGSSQNLDCLGMSLDIARISAECGVQKFFGVGTCYEYDWPNSGKCNEISTPTAPHTVYDVSKDACRRVMCEFFRDLGVDFTWGRLFFMYGPGEARSRLVPMVIRSLLNRNRYVCKAGNLLRDFMDVRDVGRAIVSIIESRTTGCVNIASGQAISIQDLVRNIESISGRTGLIRYESSCNEPENIVADVSLLSGIIGFKPEYDLKVGLEYAYRYWSGRM